MLANGACSGAAVAAIAVAWIFAHSNTVAPYPPVIARPETGAAVPVSVPFAQRFPETDDLASGTPGSDAQLKQAKDQLAKDLFAQMGPSVDESRSSENVPVVKTPLPRSRPLASKLMADYGSVGNDAQQSPAKTPFDVRTALQNVFAMLQPPGVKLASATPDGGVFNDGQDNPPALAGYGKQTAVYDIAARTVYMPNGTKLEAHSGLGELLDDPRSISVHDRGATPPNIYELSLREKPFFGVRAIRLKPVGDGDLFGRSGLLAHSYLMGPTGDSNGCVSFKNYDAFLNAYTSGEVKRLVVVKSLSNETVKEAGKA
jgi:hypothetical protein